MLTLGADGPFFYMQSADNKKFIDIDAVFQSKNPGLYRLIPRFLISYLKKITHQDEINQFIKRHGKKREFEFVAAILDEFGARIEFSGLENVPEKGGFVLAANHPLGGLDAMALVHVLSQRRTDIRFVVNDILLQLKNLQGIFIGVNKHGRNIMDVFTNLDALYASGQGVLIFPAGLVSRKRSGMIRDLEWKKSFITKARKYQLPVIPVHIGGRNSNFFYNLSNLRTRLGIKANIEMLYLPDEMYKQKGKTIPIIFGKPVQPEIFDRSVSDQIWAERIKNHVYRLPEEGHDIIFNYPK
jgi:putative hemolysin